MNIDMMNDLELTLLEGHWTRIGKPKYSNGVYYANFKKSGQHLHIELDLVPKE